MAKRDEKGSGRAIRQDSECREFRSGVISRYFFIIPLIVAILAGGCSDEDATCPADVDAPLVVRTYPADGDTLVPSDTFITVEFSEMMRPSTVSAGAFALEGPFGIADIKVSYTGSTVRLIPLRRLAGHSLYTVRVDEGVMDLPGNRMGVPYSWHFTTDDTQLLVYPEVEYTVRDSDLDGDADELVGGGPPGRILRAGIDGSVDDRAVIEFPLDEIAQDQVIAAVVFVTLSFSTLPDHPGYLEGWGFNADGSGAVTDWGNGALMSAYAGGEIFSGTTIGFPMTDAVNAALSSGATHIGFRLAVTGGGRVEVWTTTDNPGSAARMGVVY